VTSLSIEADCKPGRMPGLRRLIVLGLSLIALSLITSLLNGESWRAGGPSVVWLSNGLLIGVLLCSPRRQWPAFFVLAYVIDVGVNLALKNPVGISFALSMCNMIEVAIASFLMYPAIQESADLTQPKQLKALLLYGVLLAPLVSALLATLSLRQAYSGGFLRALQFWFEADVLGIATATPLYLSFYHGRRFSRQSWSEAGLLFLLNAAVAIWIFHQSIYPMVWLIMLCLLLLGVRLGFTAAAAVLLLVLFIGGHYTLTGRGPIGLWPHASMAKRVMVLQTFVAIMAVVLYGTEGMMAAARRLREELTSSESRFRLLAETSRDVIVLSNMDGVREYVSPAVTEMLGWLPEELTGEDYTQIVHPEDVGLIGRHLSDLLAGEEPTIIQYRGRNKMGSYQWLEANIRLVHDDAGKAEGYVYTVRDISSRKAAEAEREQAFEMVERRATEDGLTGVANRYLLDKTLDAEWNRAMVEGTSISLLLIDVDHFKAYNDIYGHVAGDECLRRIAHTVQACIHRSNDLLARYGGEEFVVILPETTSEGAKRLCEQVRSAVEACAMPHGGNLYEVVTVSIGCATEIPMPTMRGESLLRAADIALYQAKSAGRNQMRVAGEEGETLAVV
jgi:diguanylate cyclase (GGDEF)-like protein/PAS domain S-box-containing protein